MKHQYVDRLSGVVATEHLFYDRIVNFLYSHVRENAPAMFRLLTTQRVSHLLATANFDLPLGSSLLGNRRFLTTCGVTLEECTTDPINFRTAREIFERQIRYWKFRPMPADAALAVCPCDSRVVIGSLSPERVLFVKNKFFAYEELLGCNSRWCNVFWSGDFCVFRLTPDKYHYNHAPVAGAVEDFYEVPGEYHSCNPGALVELVTPYSRNRRAVTILQTDVPGGTQVGFVAMIEVGALMIGEIIQCYSESRYEKPEGMRQGMFLNKGQPKSLFRPGSSAVILFFERDRIEFEPDLVRNLYREGAESRFSRGFQQPLVETDIKVRSPLARRWNNG